jgi:hypothetical protein
MGSKKVRDRMKLIYLSNVGKGCPEGSINGMVGAVMSMKDGRVQGVGSSAGDQRKNSSLNRICGTASEYQGYT